MVLSFSASAAGVYKFIAADGTVTYSDSKPRFGAYHRFKPSCLTSYIGCDLSHADWSRVPLNRTAYHQLITRIAARYGVDPDLVRALIHAESNFNERAVSKAGAQGLMQLMPDTQKRFGVKNPYNVGENIEAGTKLLKQLLQRYHNNIDFAAAAYNAGEDAVTRYNGVPPYEETQNYVQRVNLLFHRYRKARKS